MRAVIWVKDRGAEFAEIALGDGQLRAAGVAVGASPLPYQLEYELHCGPDRYLTRRLSVRARGAAGHAGWNWNAAPRVGGRCGQPPTATLTPAACQPREGMLRR